MSKKNWISVKRGLSEDPKHRQAMGEAVWLFLHIIDAADWEKGIVYDWRDCDVANDMSLSQRTVRDWRQRLQDAGYIKCEQRQHSLDVIIHNWTDPRSYSGKVLNKKQGDTAASPSEIQGDTQGDTEGDTQGTRQSRVNPTPFIESKSTSTPEGTAAAVFKTYEAEIGLITSKIADSINDLLDHNTPTEWIIDALEIASKQNHRSWAYAEAILKRWAVQGRGEKTKHSEPAYRDLN